MMRRGTVFHVAEHTRHTLHVKQNRRLQRARSTLRPDDDMELCSIHGHQGLSMQSMMMGFIDQMRSQGHAVESVDSLTLRAVAECARHERFVDRGR